MPAAGLSLSGNPSLRLPRKATGGPFKKCNDGFSANTEKQRLEILS